MVQTEITGHCRHHSFETSASICNRCGGEYCLDCVVQPLGRAKPLCKDCAMIVSGVRTHAALPAMSKRFVRARAKALLNQTDQPLPDLTPIEDLVAEPQMACASTAPDPAAGVAPPIDWSRPFG